MLSKTNKNKLLTRLSHLQAAASFVTHQDKAWTTWSTAHASGYASASACTPWNHYVQSYNVLHRNTCTCLHTLDVSVSALQSSNQAAAIYAEWLTRATTTENKWYLGGYVESVAEFQGRITQISWEQKPWTKCRSFIPIIFVQFCARSLLWLWNSNSPN